MRICVIFSMKYVCCWSGGKDSTASIILAHEHGEPLDLILSSEVMYDKARGISGENPAHMQFMREVAKPLFEKWGYQVEIVRGNTDYLERFHRKIERPVKYPEHKGMEFGFPLCGGGCYVKRDCKVRPMDDRLSEIGEEYCRYVGICVDEPDRLVALHKTENMISLLERYGYTEEMAMEKCREYGLLSPAYQFSRRQGCWFCPNAKRLELLEIKKRYPDVWKEFVSLESLPNIANVKWNCYKKQTLHEIDEMLEWDIRQMSIFDMF